MHHSFFFLFSFLDEDLGPLLIPGKHTNELFFNSAPFSTTLPSEKISYHVFLKRCIFKVIYQSDCRVEVDRGWCITGATRGGRRHAETFKEEERS